MMIIMMHESDMTHIRMLFYAGPEIVVFNIGPGIVVGIEGIGEIVGVDVGLVVCCCCS